MQPGCLALHGNRLEDLSEAVLSWLQRHPLPGLTPEAVLVQSNGMAEWFKMTAAQQLGVCAAMQVELPARFVWRTYRQLLGRGWVGEADANRSGTTPSPHHAEPDDGSPLPVPTQLPLDKEPLVWRLMAGLAHRAALAADGDTHEQRPDPAADDPALAWSVAPLQQPAAQQLAWAQRVADLFDQYQVYRPDWLADWQSGHDVLRPSPEVPLSAAAAVPPDLAWQPALWRQVVAALSPLQRRLTRPALHREALRRLRHWPLGQPLPGLPPRLVLFGTTQLPLQTLELLAALARHIPVLLAVPNPCRHDWAHLGPDARTEGHPLLATWGRQSRDFIRHLDRFDEVQRHRQAFDMPRVDLFSEGPGDTLLGQLQADIRDMTPLAERRAQAHARPPSDDRSVQFHVAHSALREVEVLHDQLLQQLAQPAPAGHAPLQPRDIVVMVPDVETFAPAIRAVFGQYGRGDARHIPWGIADVNERGELPLLQTVGWLLQAEQHRYTASELQDLLALPALTARLGLSDDEAAELGQWVTLAGLRWGLDAQQRAQVLAPVAPGGAPDAALLAATTPDGHTWRWALDRLLWGYAAGQATADGAEGSAEAWPEVWQGLLPVPHIGGLGATLLGPLETLLERLRAWSGLARQQLTPTEWALQARQLLDDLFLPQTDRERDALAALDDGLSRWLSHAETAGFAEPVPIAVLRDAWLQLLQPAGLQQRFKAGGVTFCTLLPMRAVPFEMVCLLGMNDGSYPRSQPPSPLDLMQLPGQARAGDRSRRDDDRQLMLDAVLAARRLLYVSWVGRSVRDNTVCEPSVLVAQLRDHLDAGWGESVCAERTTEHPLQPFSRRCFEQPADGAVSPWFTHAHEWRSLHEGPLLPAARGRATTQTAAGVPTSAAAALEGEPPTPAEARWSLDTLARWLQNPPRQWLRERAGVWLDTGLPNADEDDEPFGVGALSRHSLLLSLSAWPPERLRAQGSELLACSGDLPWGGAGDQAADDLLAQAADLRQRAEMRLGLALHELPPLEIDTVVPPLEHDGTSVWLYDAVTGLRALPAAGHAEAVPSAAPATVPAEASPAAPGEAPVATPCTNGTPRALRVVVTASSLFARRGSQRVLKADKLIAGWVQALACAAAGWSVRWEWVAPDATLALQLPTEGAAQRLSQVLQACQRARHAPLPPAAVPRSALALLAEDLEGARLAFEGQTDDSGPEAPVGAIVRGPRPERADPAVQRCFASFDALRAAPGHQEAVDQLYGALAGDLRQLERIWPAADGETDGVSSEASPPVPAAAPPRPSANAARKRARG